MAYHVITLASYAESKLAKNQAAIKAAWKNNEDFEILSVIPGNNGRYLNRADAEKYLPGDKFEVRYGQWNEKVMILP